MFSIHFSKYLDLGFSGQMQSFALLYRKLLNCFNCIHAHNVEVFCCTTLQWNVSFYIQLCGHGVTRYNYVSQRRLASGIFSNTLLMSSKVLILVVEL